MCKFLYKVFAISLIKQIQHRLYSTSLRIGRWQNQQGNSINGSASAIKQTYNLRSTQSGDRKKTTVSEFNPGTGKEN